MGGATLFFLFYIGVLHSTVANQVRFARICSYYASISLFVFAFLFSKNYARKTGASLNTITSSRVHTRQILHYNIAYVATYIPL